jgi:YbbR domain-containing protein
MKEFLMKDSILKIISFVIAILLWFYIIAVIDPSVDVTIKDIPIRYTNKAVIEEKGLCLISDPTMTVELKIRGSRKRIANIDNKNIYATVDLANISKTGTFSLPVGVSIPYEYNEIVSKNPYNVSIVIDKVVSAERDVKVITGGSVANGYIEGTPLPSEKRIALKGASSMINRIKHVGAKLDFDGRSEDITDTEKLFFINNEGKQISYNDEIYNLVKMNIEELEVSCPVYKLKTVPLKVNVKVKNNIENYKISAQMSNVTIYAEDEILDTVSEVYTKEIDVDQLTNESVVTEIELPEGVYLRDAISEVTVKVEKRN